MIYRTCVLLSGLIAVAMGAHAGTTHRVHFSNPAKVVVWTDGGFAGQGQVIPVLTSSEPQGAPILGSGTLEATDVMSVSNDQRVIVRIASNAGFVIETAPSSSVELIQARVLSEGVNAQADSSRARTGTGIVFEQLTKTAIRPGAPESQAIDVELTWRGVTPDLFIRVTD